jgi:dTDP-4-amino-4,6-dideoxygalactose transaminase
MLSIVNNDYTFSQLCATPGRRPSAPFADNLQRFLGTRSCHLTSCGFSALQLVLKAMAAVRPGRTEVIIPAYTAPGLVLPIQKLGLTVRLCDISAETFLIDSKQLPNSAGEQTLAVIAVNMFGIPADIAAVRSAAGPDIFVIEDCAQSLGSEREGAKTAASADAVFGSFGRGKNFSLYHGGFFALNNDVLQDAVLHVCRELPPASPAAQRSPVIKHLLFSLVTQPALYSVLQKPLSHCKSRKEQTVFPFADFGARIDRTASTLFDLWRSVYARRIENGECFLRTFTAIRGIRLPAVRHSARIAFNRLPLLVENERLIQPLLQRLLRAGIEGSIMYGKPVHAFFPAERIDGNFPAADHLARHLLTLPVHGQVPKDSITRAAEIIATFPELHP